MPSLKTWPKFIWAGLLALLGVGLFFFLKARGNGKSAAHILANLSASWHAQDVSEKRAELQRLQQEVTVDLPKVEQLQEAIEAKKVKLAQKYEASGLSRDEVLEKLRAIDL